MTEGEAKGIVTVSMIWLGVLIVVSHDWLSAVRADIQSKAGTSAAPPAPAPATPTPVTIPMPKVSLPNLGGLRIPGVPDIPRPQPRPPTIPRPTIQIGGPSIGGGFVGFPIWLIGLPGKALHGFLGR